MYDIYQQLTVFPLSFFIGLLFCLVILTMIFSWHEISERYSRWVSNPDRQPIYHHTLQFFDQTINLITVIGVIAAVISLPALFLPPFLGDNWYEFLIASPLGSQLLVALPFATIFSVFFIYLLMSLIFVKWLNQIFFNNDVSWGETIFSLTILVIGVIAAFFINYFLLMISFAKGEIPIILFGLNALLFILGIAFILMISGFIDVSATVSYLPLRIFLFSLVCALFILMIVIIGVPSYDINNEILQITKKYSVLDKANFSFQTVPISNNNTPIILLIQPDFSQYNPSNINAEYAQCHWSTNYGHFFTFNTKDFFIAEQSNDFIILACIQNQDENIYWTYDLSDFDKNKTPVIISLRVENPNKKLLNGKWKNNVDYIIGSTHKNFTWIDQNNITQNDHSYF